MDQYFDVLKKYAVFEGRAGRREYWMFVLFSFIVSIVVAIIGSVLGAIVHLSIFGTIISWAYSLAVLLPSLAVGVRRLHDTGREGWWMLICLIPFIGAIIFIVFMVLESQPVSNKYGPNPNWVPIEKEQSPQAPQQPGAVS